MNGLGGLGRGLVLVGLGLLLLGLLLVVLSKFGLSRLPGDVVVQRKNFTFYAPVGLMILVSVVLTLLLNLFARR